MKRLLDLRALTVCLLAILANPIAAEAEPVGPQLSVSLESEVSEPIEIGRQFWYTVRYSCSGEDCIDPTLAVEIPAEMHVLNSLGDDNFPVSLATRSGSTLTFRAVGSQIAAGASGELQVLVFFKYGEVCSGIAPPAIARMSAEGATDAESSPVNVEALAEFKWEASLIHEGGDAVDEEVVYQIELFNPVFNIYGGYHYFDPEIRLSLPEGAEFVRASDEGLWDTSTGQAVWQLPTQLSIYGGSSPSRLSRTVTIRYPSPQFSQGDLVQASMDIVGSGPPDCPTVYILSDSQTIELNVAYHEVDLEVFGTWWEWLGYGNFSSIRFHNTGNVALQDFSLTHPVPVKREVQKIQTGRFKNADVVAALLSIQVNDVDQWIPIGTYDATRNTTLDVLPEPDQDLINAGFEPTTDLITALKWEYGTIPVGFQFYSPNVWTQDKPGTVVLIPEVDREGNSSQAGDVYLSCATASYTFDGEAQSAEHCYTHKIVPDEPRVAAGIWTPTQLRFPGDEVTWRANFNNAGSAPVHNFTGRVTLPDEFEFLGWELTPENLANGWSQGPTSPDSDVISVTNNTLAEQSSELLFFRVRVKPTALVDAKPQICIGFESDERSTDPYVCRDHVTVGGLASVAAAKQIQGANNFPDYAAAGEHAVTVQGGPANYRLTVRNTGNVPLEGVSVIDILPHQGDVNVLDATASRGSVWTPQLTGPIIASDDVVVSYSSSTNPCRADLGISGPSGCESDTWTSEPPSPITSVRSLRFDFTSQLDGGAERVFDWPMVVPFGAQFDSRACNSYAYVARRADNGQMLLPAEPAAVCAVIEELEPAALGDYVWEDTNYNGLQDEGESGINGVSVTLMQPVRGGDAVIATNRDGLPMQTVTADNADDESGYYLFSNLKPGDYFIRVTPPEGKAFTRSDGGDEARDSDVDPSTGESAAIDLKAIVLYTVDVGLRPPNSPPIASAGKDAVQECLASSGTTVTLDGSDSTDPDGASLTYSWSDAEGTLLATGVTATVELSLGSHTITLTVTDDKGASSTDQVEVVVEDTTPPAITFAGGGLTLWPPNHKYHPIDLASLATVTDQCDATAGIADLALTLVTSDEAEDARGGGDGRTTDDIVIDASCQAIDVRAERLGGSDGRVYTAFVSLTDEAGNTGVGSLTIGVPHSRNDTPVDSGVAYQVDAQCTVASKGGAPMEEAALIPTDYELGNYPNPFNPVTTIRYGLPEAEHVRLEVFDMAGRRIALLVDGPKDAGTHEVRFDSRSLSSGLYLYRMQTAVRVMTGHMVLLK